MPQTDHAGALDACGAAREQLRAEQDTAELLRDELTLRAAADCYGVAIHLLTSTDANWYLTYQPTGAPSLDARSPPSPVASPAHPKWCAARAGHAHERLPVGSDGLVAAAHR